MSRDEVQSSSVVDSVVNERGVKVSDGVVGPAAKKHFGVLRGVVDPVFNVKFGDPSVDFLLNVSVWNWAFDYRVASCA